MVLLESEKFLTELEKCYTASKAKKKGSLFLTMKRFDGRDKPVPRQTIKADLPQPEEYQCLVRVVYGKRKLTCRISSQEINKFQMAFSALMRSGMSNLGKASAQTVFFTQTKESTTSQSSKSTSTSAKVSSAAGGSTASPKKSPKPVTKKKP
ncbi:hypothetical protein RvY_08825 [Ramazzottius varieornatus]|uniref:Signal recognition particle 14 kDa protein n=1 Tax=Ramazzottius varieornatus TaxID=947166 RepID=A0A1D1V9G1_RAMVA|nr:hypothetical protein RvY_08825 [Ramazzottius varieornatus]